MVSWQQTLVPSAIFYLLASVIAFGIAFMIAGLAAVLRRLEAKGGTK